MTKPLASRIASSPAPRAASATPPRGARQSRRACRRGRAHARRPRRTRRRDPQGRRQRHAGAAQPHRFRRHRPARSRAARAPRQDRHPRRQRRRRRPLLAARPYRSKAVDRRDGRQRHREFPVDPLHGAAAENVRRRPRRVRHLRRRQQGPRLFGPYAASKAALEALVRVWADETANTQMRVNLFNPGPIRTRMRATVFPGEDPTTLDTPEQAAEFIVPMCAPCVGRDRQVLRLQDADADELSRAGVD